MSDTSTLIAIKYKGQMIDLPTGGGSADTSAFVTKTQLYDIETTTTEPSYAKGDVMWAGKDGYDSSSQSFQMDSQTNKAYFVFNNLTEQENIWSYSYYGDYCYMEIINRYNNNSVYGWFVLYKDGSVVMTSENLSVNQISLEYRTSGWPMGLLIFVDDQNINTNAYSYMVGFYKCTYTPGETDTTYTIKESLLPDFAKISYISQSDYDNLQVKDPSTLYIIPS